MPDALTMTVHAMPAPDLDARQRRRRGGRRQMLLVLLACAAPVLVSYLSYYVIRPEGRTNYAELVTPTREIPAGLSLRTLDGQPVDPSGLRGQWLLLVVSDASCDPACEGRVYLQRQLREMLGKERDRVDRVWLVTGAGAPAPALVQAAQATPGLKLLKAERDALAGWLQPASGQALEDHVYIVDPMGRWMMRAPVDPDPAKLKRDLDRLLRASSSWDRAGA